MKVYNLFCRDILKIKYIYVELIFIFINIYLLNVFLYL